MQVLDGQGDLEEVQLSLGLVQLHLLVDLGEQLPALCQVQHVEEEIGLVDHIFQVYDARVVHRLKDPYLVQHVGGAVVAVEGADDCALASDLDGNPVQVWHPEAQLNLSSGPLPQHLAHLRTCSTREGSCQRWPPLT